MPLLIGTMMSQPFSNFSIWQEKYKQFSITITQAEFKSITRKSLNLAALSTDIHPQTPLFPLSKCDLSGSKHIVRAIWFEAIKVISYTAVTHADHQAKLPQSFKTFHLIYKITSHMEQCRLNPKLTFNENKKKF